MRFQNRSKKKQKKAKKMQNWGRAENRWSHKVRQTSQNPAIVYPQEPNNLEEHMFMSSQTAQAGPGPIHSILIWNAKKRLAPGELL